MRRITPFVFAALLALALPPLASAGYDPAGDPAKGSKGSSTAGLKVDVCKSGCDFKKIQDAVDAVGKNATVKVKDGTYKEGVVITGKAKEGLKLIGNAKAPKKVLLDQVKLKGAAAQNGVRVERTNKVTIQGFKARNFKSNGFFALFADDYSMKNLIAERSGRYGLYAFNARGGEMLNSEAYYHNDAGTYVGQTPPQSKPKRTLLKGIKSWGNAQGHSGQNMRYVTITDSDWYNNGTGLTFTSRDSEKFTPEEQNTLSGNRIFFNNYNFYTGKAAFEIPENTFAGGLSFPIGVGLLLYGGFDNTIEDNQFMGNYLAGVAAINSLEVTDKCQGCKPESEILKRNKVESNTFGNGGANLNGRDIVYTGQGVGNCFQNNSGAIVNFPTDNSTVTCPAPTQPNAESPGALGDIVAFSGVAGDDKSIGWIAHDQTPIDGITPVVSGNPATGNPK